MGPELRAFAVSGKTLAFRRPNILARHQDQARRDRRSGAIAAFEAVDVMDEALAAPADRGRGRVGDGRRAPGQPPIFAALDLGTNNCRLMIAARTSNGFRIIDSFSRIVRLGEGLAMSGRLGEAAMERA